MKEIKDKTPEQKLQSEQAYLDYLYAKGRVSPSEYEAQMEELRRLEGQPSNTIARVLKEEFLIS